jgi:hypothetical protein
VEAPAISGTYPERALCILDLLAIISETSIRFRDSTDRLRTLPDTPGVNGCLSRRRAKSLNAANSRAAVDRQPFGCCRTLLGPDAGWGAGVLHNKPEMQADKKARKTCIRLRRTHIDAEFSVAADCLSGYSHITGKRGSVLGSTPQSPLRRLNRSAFHVNVTPTSARTFSKHNLKTK